MRATPNVLLVQNIWTKRHQQSVGSSIARMTTPHVLLCKTRRADALNGINIIKIFSSCSSWFFDKPRTKDYRRASILITFIKLSYGASWWLVTVG